MRGARKYERPRRPHARSTRAYENSLPTHRETSRTPLRPDASTWSDTRDSMRDLGGLSRENIAPRDSFHPQVPLPPHGKLNANGQESGGVGGPPKGICVASRFLGRISTTVARAWKMSPGPRGQAGCPSIQEMNPNRFTPNTAVLTPVCACLRATHRQVRPRTGRQRTCPRPPASGRAPSRGRRAQRTPRPAWNASNHARADSGVFWPPPSVTKGNSGSSLRPWRSWREKSGSILAELAKAQRPSASSASALSSQKRMSISRYIVIAVVRCS